jgi:predicted GNAT family acetyltransferase
VSVCFSARNGPLAAEAGVETLADFRGQGHAAAVTAAWAAQIQAEGRIPIYSTWWGNDASQAVARRLGLRMFGSGATWD